MLKTSGNNNLVKKVFSIEGLVFLVALVALGLSIGAMFKDCGEPFGDESCEAADDQGTGTIGKPKTKKQLQKKNKQDLWCKSNTDDDCNVKDVPCQSFNQNNCENNPACFFAGQCDNIECVPVSGPGPSPSPGYCLDLKERCVPPTPGKQDPCCHGPDVLDPGVCTKFGKNWMCLSESNKKVNKAEIYGVCQKNSDCADSRAKCKHQDAYNGMVCVPDTIKPNTNSAPGGFGVRGGGEYDGPSISVKKQPHISPPTKPEFGNNSDTDTPGPARYHTPRLTTDHKPTPKPGGGGLSTETIIWISVGGGVGLLVIIALILYFMKKRKM
jgi:hypothetical protein